MKKKVLLFLMIICTVCFFAGCGEQDKDKEQEKETTTQEKEEPLVVEKEEDEEMAEDTEELTVTVGEYKGLEIDKVVVLPVTDDMVESDIKTTLQTLDISKIKGPAKLGDLTIIDYVGKLDGVAFQGGTQNDANLTLGSKTFIDGFEEGIVGHSVGDVFDLNLTFPTNYKNTELAGKQVVFTVTLDSIIRIPELTDALLPEIGTKAKTVAEYKAEVKKDLETKAEEDAKIQRINAVLNALGNVTEVSGYPQNRLIRITKDLVFSESYRAMVNNYSIDTAIYASYGKTVDEVVKQQVATEMAIEYVAEKEGLTITEEAYTKQVSKMAEAYGESNLKQFVEEFEMVYGKGYIHRMMLKESVGNFLVEHCKEVEKK